MTAGEILQFILGLVVLLISAHAAVLNKRVEKLEDKKADKEMLEEFKDRVDRIEDKVDELPGKLFDTIKAFLK